jgi:hypothetical protein
VISFPEDPVDWFTRIGTTGARIGVELSPVGPAWSKHLQTQNGLPIGGDATGPILGIEENLLVSGAIPWTGWHSEITTTGFVWWTGGQFVPVPSLLANGLPVQVTFAMSGQSLDLTFPPLVPGTTVTLFQKFGWPQDISFAGTIELRQFSVPEPASVLGLSALFPVSHRRRHLARKNNFRSGYHHLPG